jgi:NACalpha-BTF3-like transcription factor
MTSLGTKMTDLEARHELMIKEDDSKMLVEEHVVQLQELKK